MKKIYLIINGIIIINGFLFFGYFISKINNHIISVDYTPQKEHIMFEPIIREYNGNDSIIDNNEKNNDISEKISKDNNQLETSSTTNSNNFDDKLSYDDKSRITYLSLFNMIFNIYLFDDDVYKNILMQTITKLNSLEIVDILLNVMSGIAPFSSEIIEMPEDIIYAIKETIRRMSNEDVGEFLAQKYDEEASEEKKLRLLEINHPVMVARMAMDAFNKGDFNTSDKLMETLADDNDNIAIKGIMLLAREKSIPIDSLSQMISSWSISNSDNDQTHLMFVEYLGNTEYTIEERLLAACAIANEKDKQMAIFALTKAQMFEENPIVRAYIDEAIYKIVENDQNKPPVDNEYSENNT